MLVRIKNSSVQIRNMKGSIMQSQYVVGFYLAILMLAWIFEWYIFKISSLLFSIFMVLYANERKYFDYGRKMLKWVHRAHKRLFGLQREVKINPYRSNKPQLK